MGQGIMSSQKENNYVSRPFGNSTEINAKELQKDLEATIVEGETVVKAFRIVRGLFIFTDKRLLLIDKQGLTGKKAEYHSIPYKSISLFRLKRQAHSTWMRK